MTNAIRLRLGIAAVFAIPVALSGQAPPRVSGRTPKPGEISLVQAKRIGEAFLKQIPWKYEAALSSASLTNLSGVPTWSLDLGEANLHIDAKSGRVSLFRNNRRVRERVYKIPVPAIAPFHTEAQAKSFAVGMARRLGIPPEARLARFEWVGAKKSAEGLARGSVRASFSLSPRDFPSFGCGNGGGVRIDGADGALEQFGYRNNTRYAKPVRRLPKAQALHTATSLWAKERHIHSNSQRVLEAFEAYTLPLRRFMLNGGTDRSLLVAKLCWIVRFEGGTVAIDEEDGSVYDVRKFKGSK